jgi:hypothetical protein
MKSQNSIRPEDFKYAWINAYHLAILQVADIRKDIETEIDLSKKILNKAHSVQLDIEKNSNEIVVSMKVAAEKASNSIEFATKMLMEKSDFLGKNLVNLNYLKKTTDQKIIELAEDRKSFDDAVYSFYKKSVFQRIWCAIFLKNEYFNRL